MKKASIVLGCGFGDEGKGKVTNWLSKSTPNKSLVIRFNGGHQAGHTVVDSGVRHVFSSFGSGTLNGTPTFISKYCTLFPPALLMELKDLQAKEILPFLFVDPMTMITTPYDVSENRFQEVNTKTAHGSCGAGFGKTVERHETLNHSHRIFAKDLSCEWIVRQKLQMIEKYLNVPSGFIDIEAYINSCCECSKVIKLRTEIQLFSNPGFEHFIFEGAQGILLDREHGIFPHVTRSATTSKNPMEMLKVFSEKVPTDIYYTTRCYQTRHGNGPLFGEEFEINLSNNERETNVYNEWQGVFRKAPLSLDLLRYAIQSDSVYHNRSVSTNLVVSHLDQFPENKIPVILHNEKTPVTLSKEMLIEQLVKSNLTHQFFTSNSKEM